MNPNYQKMMKQVQKMQTDMAKAQEESGQGGSGGVCGRRHGHGQSQVADLNVQEVRIDPAAIDPDDLEILQDMILAATNEALRMAREVEQKRMGAITSGLNLPNIPGLMLADPPRGPLRSAPPYRSSSTSWPSCRDGSRPPSDSRFTCSGCHRKRPFRLPTP